MKKPIKPTDGNFHRSIRVLEAVAESGDNPRFAELEKLLGFPKATLNRLLGQLQEEELILFDESTQRYSLGFKLMALARRSWQNMDVRRLAFDQLEWLAQHTNESVQLAMRAETEMVYIDSIECTQSVRMSVRVGDRIPMYCSSTGKAFLANMCQEESAQLIGRMRFAATTQATITSPEALATEINQVRQQGYAIDREEHYVGVCCVASPILNSKGEPIAAFSVAAPSFRAEQETLVQWSELVKTAADIVSSRLPPWG